MILFLKIDDDVPNHWVKVMFAKFHYHKVIKVTTLPSVTKYLHPDAVGLYNFLSLTKPSLIRFTSISDFLTLSFLLY